MTVKLIKGYQIPAGEQMDYSGYAGYAEAMFHGADSNDLYAPIPGLEHMGDYDCCGSVPRTMSNYRSFYGDYGNDAQGALIANQANIHQAAVVEGATMAPTAVSGTDAVTAYRALNLSVPTGAQPLEFALIGLYMIKSYDPINAIVVVKPAVDAASGRPPAAADTQASQRTLQSLADERGVPATSLVALGAQVHALLNKAGFTFPGDSGSVSTGLLVAGGLGAAALGWFLLRKKKA